MGSGPTKLHVRLASLGLSHPGPSPTPFVPWHLTPPSSGQPKASCAGFRLPLMSNVRPQKVSFDLAEHFLATAEATAGATLPASYRRSMSSSNGGEVEVEGEVWELFPIADTSDRRRLSRTAGHVIVETSRLSEWPRFPKHALAIASNGTGDVLLFLRFADKLGSAVYEWSHETGELNCIAGDFSELERR